ncbi:MAG: PIG-L family deacetylase [Chitinophagaceae bacterium]|nr:PIG-L family deacetylase [Chitinophagaceae bacterium]MCW5904994.1 PIG-L family deacetylase [Chitinophagaceae bacterium]
MKKIFFIYCLLLIVPSSVFAQTSSNDIYLQLKKLNVLGSVLYIGAHPDDENNYLLPYLAKEKLYRTAYLSLTRGDGGQNLIGNEQGIELGLIRTQELLAARKIDGSEQYFTRAYEFGFSKSSDESLKMWDKEKVLADVVWVIRKYQPDIIINRFPPDKRAGHGHHASAAIIAEEAFTAAADATKFPEQLKQGVQIWQAKRIVWNTFNFGNNNTTNNNQLKIEIGNFNPLLGNSYGEIGGIARSMHKSQGEGRPQRKGIITEYFAYVNGDSLKNDLMDGVNTHWSRINGTEKIQQAINTIINNFNFDNPSLSVPALVNVYNTLQKLPKNNWTTFKAAEVQQLIMQCSSLFAEATSNTEYAVQGEKINVSFFVNNRLDNNIQLKKISLHINNHSFDSVFHLALNKNENYQFVKDFIIPTNAPITQPYWLEQPMQNNMFQINGYANTGEAENKPAYTAQFIFNIAGTDFIYNAPLQYKYVHPVRGEVYQPVIVTTPITVALTPNVILTNVVNNNTNISKPIIHVQYKSLINKQNVAVHIALHQGDKIIYTKDTIQSLKEGVTYQFQAAVNNIFNTAYENNITASVSLNINHATTTYTQNVRNITYDHIPNQHYFFRDNAQIITESVNAKPLKVGYIEGAGDKVPEALEQLGCSVTLLSEKDINITTLQQFDAVVTGIRAYNIHEYLTDKNGVLNEYIKNGGNLIVQYIKANKIGNKTISSGPYHFIVNSRSRVTEENAAINFLLPNHAVLNYPNLIGYTDFDNWVQERSTYQAEQLDKNFETILSMQDTGEPASNGSLIIAKYGKGNFVYCGLVLFRQLPAGNIGAYRLLANMLALPQNK